MTVSTDPSAPLVVVVGSTGMQGGSVIRNLVDSNKPYRLRGLTRDLTKDAAEDLRRLGVDVVAVDIRVGNEDAVYAACTGADIVFGVTSSGTGTDEEAQGRIIADAAFVAHATRFVFSGLPHVSQLSGGKFKNMRNCDPKARVVDYARTTLGLNTVDVQAGYYMTNLLDIPGISLERLADGTYCLRQGEALARDALWPYIDTAHDYGLFVRYAIESPDYAGGGTIYTYGEWLRSADVARILERVRNVKVKLVSVDARAMFTSLGLPHHFLEMVEGPGYYYGLETAAASEQKKVFSNLARKPRTLAEFLEANPHFLVN